MKDTHEKIFLGSMVVISVISILIITSIGTNREKTCGAKIASQQEIIESLRAEIKTYQAIGNIIDSRCVDVMEPKPMEVGE